MQGKNGLNFTRYGTLGVDENGFLIHSSSGLRVVTPENGKLKEINLANDVSIQNSSGKHLFIAGAGKIEYASPNETSGGKIYPRYLETEPEDRYEQNCGL